MKLKHASALVVGGASGIGEASARLLTRAGARCVILDRDHEKAEVVASQISGAFVAADVANEAEVQAGVDAATSLGPLRVLVNSAGIGEFIRTVGSDGTPFPLDRFERVLSVNLVGTFNCLRLAAAAMAKTDPTSPDSARGVIVNLSSIAAFEGQVGQAAYSASKGGVVALTLAAARDLAGIGIRVNTIAPGAIDTPIYGDGDTAEALKRRVAGQSLFPQRLGTANEVASLVMEIVRNDYINGETIRIDAGSRVGPAGHQSTPQAR
jgi:NAD(P)-dependent dehydrogenase (short-subunit alcohol dehydrogenase family)